MCFQFYIIIVIASPSSSCWNTFQVISSQTQSHEKVHIILHIHLCSWCSCLFAVLVSSEINQLCKPHDDECTCCGRIFNGLLMETLGRPTTITTVTTTIYKYGNCAWRRERARDGWLVCVVFCDEPDCLSWIMCDWLPFNRLSVVVTLFSSVFEIGNIKLCRWHEKL